MLPGHDEMNALLPWCSALPQARKQYSNTDDCGLKHLNGRAIISHSCFTRILPLSGHSHKRVNKAGVKCLHKEDTGPDTWRTQKLSWTRTLTWKWDHLFKWPLYVGFYCFSSIFFLQFGQVLIYLYGVCMCMCRSMCLFICVCAEAYAYVDTHVEVRD